MDLNMSYTTVHASLKELFPQIDSRALRAVAIEHSHDVDAAVVAVLEEIIPFFNERSTPSSPFNRSVSGEGGFTLDSEAVDRMLHGDSFVSVNRRRSTSLDGCLHYSETHDGTAELGSSMGTHEDRIDLNASYHSQGESLVVVDENKGETCLIEVSSDSETESETEEPISRIELKVGCIEEKEDGGDGTAQDISSSTTSGSSSEASEASDMHGSNLDKSHSSLSTEAASGGEDMSNGMATEDESDMHGSNLDKSHSSLSTEAASGGEDMDNVMATEDESTAKATLSSQIDIIDAVEEIIADARNNKKTLNLKLESVMNMIKEVELKEQAAEQARSEALTEDTNLMHHIKEFKGVLQRAKEAHDMHAGEVYGEKAVLATELRELHSRVSSLSVERDRSLADLDEMRQSLEVRLAAALNEIQCAELNKLEKGEVARKSFAEQELVMEKVVQESKMLRQQAEDNAKLHEFLVDRGQIVDTLQGELAVVCQDVKKLKENFDQNVPLGKLLSSIHTSFILASSTSSLKSSVPDQVENSPSRYDDQSMTEHYRSDETVNETVAAAREDCKAHEENDGWEFFDTSEAIA